MRHSTENGKGSSETDEFRMAGLQDTQAWLENGKKRTLDTRQEVSDWECFKESYRAVPLRFQYVCESPKVLVPQKTMITNVWRSTRYSDFLANS